MNDKHGDPTVSGIFERAFGIVAGNVGSLYVMAAVVYVPLVIAQIAVVGTLASFAFAVQSDELGVALMVASVGVAFALGVLISACADAAVTYAVARIVLGRPVSVGRALAHAARRMPALIAATVRAEFAIFCGLVCLFVPGVVVALQYSFVTPVVVLEDRTGTAALARSRRLVAGRLGTAFVVLLVVMLVGCASFPIVNVIPYAVAQVGVSLVLGPLLVAFSSAVYVVFYFSQREEFDAEFLADPLDEESAPVPEVPDE